MSAAIVENKKEGFRLAFRIKKKKNSEAVKPNGIETPGTWKVIEQCEPNEGLSTYCVRRRGFLDIRTRNQGRRIRAP